MYNIDNVRQTTIKTAISQTGFDYLYSISMKHYKLN